MLVPAEAEAEAIALPQHARSEPNRSFDGRLNAMLIDEAQTIDIEILTDFLETVPVSKIECCQLALEAMHNALADYHRKSQQ